MNKATILIFAIFFSCESLKQERTSTQKVETIQVDFDSAQNSLKMSEFFSELSYHEIKSLPGEPVGRIRKVMVQDDIIGLYDEARQCVWINTIDGEFVEKVSIPRGKGPGEIERLSDVIFTENNQIHALGAFKIVVYDLEGNLLNEIDFDFYIYKFVYEPTTKRYIGYAANSLNTHLNNNHSGKNLIIFDDSGEIIDSKIPIPRGRDHMKFMISNRFPEYNNETLFFPHLSDTVYNVTENNIVPKYALDFNENSISQEVFDKRKNYSLVPQEWVQFNEEELLNNDLVIFHFFFNEVESYLHFRVGTGENVYNIIYDKDNDITHVGPEKLTNDIDNGFVPFFYDTDDNKMYSVIESNELLRHMNQVYENDYEIYADPKMSELRNLAQTLSDNSNPILQIATFK